MNLKGFIKSRMSCNSNSDSIAREVAEVLVEKYNWTSMETALKCCEENIDKIDKLYQRGHDLEHVAKEFDRLEGYSNSESLEFLKSKLIEAYAPVYDGDVEGFESLKKSINEADVDLMKKDLDAEISNWDGDPDPIVQKAVDVSKEVRAKLDEIKTYSESCKDLEQFKIKVNNRLYDWYERMDLSTTAVERLMELYDENIDEWAKEGLDPIDVSERILEIESYD